MFALGAMLFWGFGDFFLSKAVRKAGNFLPLIFIGFFGAIIFAPKAFPLFHYLTTFDLLVLATLGFLHFAMDFFLLEGYRLGKLSVVEVLFQLELPLTIIIATTLLREFVSATMVVLFALVLTGSLLLAKFYTIKKSHFERGWWWAIVAAGFSAGVNVTTAFAAKEISPLLAIWFPWVIVSLLSLVFLWKEFDTIITKAKKSFGTLLATALFQVAAWLSFSYALSGKNLSIVAGITSGYCAITAFLGFWINDEKLNKWQIMGAIISICASIILAIAFGF